MKIEDFSSNYSLHDTPVERIQYLREDRKLCLAIDFMQYFHPNYHEDMPELAPGILELRGVRSVASDLASHSLEHGVDVEAEVLEFEMIRENIWELVVKTDDREFPFDILILTLTFGDEADVRFVPFHASADYLAIK